MALVRWEWASLTRAQAAYELARALEIAGPSGAEVLSRRVVDWARGVTAKTDALAFGKLCLTRAGACLMAKSSRLTGGFPPNYWVGTPAEFRW